jgi:hypothetical protein
LPIVNESLGAAGRALILRLDGYEPYRVDVIPSQRDVTMGVALVPAANVVAPRPRGGAASAPAARPRAESPSGNATAAGTKESGRPATPRPAPSNGLRPLDDANPWEKK